MAAPGQISAEELKKLGRSILIASVGAAVAVIEEYLRTGSFGLLTPFVTAGAAVLFNAVRLWLTSVK